MSLQSLAQCLAYSSHSKIFVEYIIHANMIDAIDQKEEVEKEAWRTQMFPVRSGDDASLGHSHSAVKW